MINRKPNQVPDVEMTPHGVVMGVVPSRPLLLLKAVSTADVMPVWMNQMQMPILLSEMGHLQGGERVHLVTFKLMAQMGVTISRCVFTELVGVHQFVDIYFMGRDGVEFKIGCRADEAMAICIAQKAKIFTSMEFIERVRSVQLDSKDFTAMFDNPEDLRALQPTLLQ